MTLFRRFHIIAAVSALVAAATSLAATYPDEEGRSYSIDCATITMTTAAPRDRSAIDKDKACFDAVIESAARASRERSKVLLGLPTDTPAPAPAPAPAPPEELPAPVDPDEADVEVPLEEAHLWREDQATRDYFDASLNRRWQHQLGDWIDADGVFMGSEPIARATVQSKTKLEIPAGVSDLLIRATKEYASFGSRESDTPPVFTSDDGAELPVLADVTLDASTVKNFATSDTLRPHGQRTVLIRLPNEDGGTLTLFASRTGGEIAAFIPAPRLPPVIIPELPSATRAVMSIEPQNARVNSPDRQKLMGNYLSAWTDYEIAPQIACNAAGATKGCGGLTILQDKRTLPEPMKRAVMVTYFRMTGDWSMTGGKLPGIGNTGDSVQPNKTCIGDNCYPDAGWGGRRANGLRWHARGLFTGAGTGGIGWGTYLYSLNINAGSYGKHLQAQDPIPLGEIVATIQYVEVNDVGADNGTLAMWLCRSTGCTPQLWQDGIRYRSVDDPQALINEMDLVIYCGGMKCAMKPGERMEYHFSGASVFDGMVDQDAVVAKIKALAQE